MSVIKAVNLTKKYGSFTAVDDISFDIKENTVVGFVGKNGAGKTTTIRCILDLIKPTQGTIIINGIDANKNSKEIKSFLSYMPSDTSFYENLTCEDIFKLCCEISKTGFETAVKYSEYFELDYRKKFKDLSLGNKKKVSIIQALLKNSKILILDEPTNGLDPLMQLKFFDLIKKLKENGTTVFLSSHNLSEIEKHCDRVIIIKSGKIVDDLDMDKVILHKKQIVTYKTKDNKEETFEFDGDANQLIQQLSKLDLQHIEIKNSSVEDEFIKYYKE